MSQQTNPVLGNQYFGRVQNVTYNSSEISGGVNRSQQNPTIMIYSTPATVSITGSQLASGIISPLLLHDTSSDGSGITTLELTANAGIALIKALDLKAVGQSRVIYITRSTPNNNFPSTFVNITNSFPGVTIVNCAGLFSGNVIQEILLVTCNNLTLGSESVTITSGGFSP